MSAKEFRKSDGDYLAWIAQHPDGFVVNRYASDNSASYMVLHTANCALVTRLSGSGRPGGFTERDYAKVCAQDRTALVDYVRAHGRPDGSFSNECTRCKP